jgi:hypothetical protein
VPHMVYWTPSCSAWGQFCERGTKNINVRFEIFTAIKIKDVVFWVVTPCNNVFLCVCVFEANFTTLHDTRHVPSNQPLIHEGQCHIAMWRHNPEYQDVTPWGRILIQKLIVYCLVHKSSHLISMSSPHLSIWFTEIHKTKVKVKLPLCSP